MKEFEIMYRITLRAVALGISNTDQITRMMDISNAHKQFDLRLSDWLNADDENFAHDFIGIQAHMDREACRITDHFLPRFAAVCHPQY